MPKHDFITIRENWPNRWKPLTEEELNEEFKTSNFKSHHAFLVYKIYGRDCLEVKFWEWMESTPIKYDEDGNVYRKRPGEPGLIYRWLLSESGPKFNTTMLIFLFGLVALSIIINTF